ncbi:MAG TPA: hypothetical protein VGC12_04695 [Methyloradius sp.]
MSNPSKKTHPMVLVAATALTIFSLLGSAAITGLIPTTPYAKQGLLQDAPDEKPTSHATNFENKTPRNKPENQGHSSNDQALMNVDNEKLNQALAENRLCHDCGIIISIKSIDQVTSDLAGNFINGAKDKVNAKTAYLIKVRMENGGYRLVTQYSEPQHGIGDIVKLDSNELVSA